LLEYMEWILKHAWIRIWVSLAIGLMIISIILALIYFKMRKWIK
jgi:hypothetical protein